MTTTSSWWSRWGKKVAGLACFAGAAVVAPAAPVAAAAIATACGALLTSDDHVKAAGGALGSGIAAVWAAVRGQKPPTK
jgi:hypothetical protein